jgi:hypothetical protein
LRGRFISNCNRRIAASRSGPRRQHLRFEQVAPDVHRAADAVLRKSQRRQGASSDGGSVANLGHASGNAAQFGERGWKEAGIGYWVRRPNPYRFLAGQALGSCRTRELMGCPDRRIDRLCITCCSPSQPSHRAGWRDLVYAANATGSL